jgi:hypothetical protein
VSGIQLDFHPFRPPIRERMEAVLFLLRHPFILPEFTPFLPDSFARLQEIISLVLQE